MRARPAGARALRALTGALLSAAACAPSPPAVESVVYDADTVLAAPVVCRLLDDRLPIVEVEVAGVTGRFVVDSGMELTLVDAAFAHRCGLTLRPFAFELEVQAAGGRTRRIEQAADIERLAIGAAHALRLTAPVVDMRALVPNLDGMLGQDVLGDWALLFDVGAHELVVLPSADVEHGLRDRLAEGTELEAIPVHGADRIPRVSLDVLGGEVELVVDTGSTHTCLPESVLRALGVGDGTPTTAVNLAGSESRSAHRVEDFPLGLQRVPLTVESTATAWGLLGYDALRQRVFVLDGPGRRLLVSRTD